MPLAPVVLFVYNRPHHTLQVLQSLKRNRLAERSELTIYCDGARPDASPQEQDDIQKVRDIVVSEQWCGHVETVMRDQNNGLAPSIVGGVTLQIGEHGKVIVLEDDLVTGTGFLDYMNDSLERYESEESVMHVSGYMFPRLRLPFSSFDEGTCFTRFMSCWGWATWKRAWDRYSDDASDLLARIEHRHALELFNLDGLARSQSMHLSHNADGTLHTWAIKWYASIFLDEGLCLYPTESLVKNIGNDGTGTHPNRTNLYAYQKLSDTVELKTIPLVESKKARLQIGHFFAYLEKKKSILDKVIEKLHLLR